MVSPTERNLFSPAYGDAPDLLSLDKPATSTADYYHNSGALTFGGAPYDLDTMGAWGAARKAAKGYRFLWFIGPNHYGFGVTWGIDAETIYVGYSNDPAIPPDPSTLVPIVTSQGVVQTGTAAVINASVAANGLTMTVNSITSGIVALGYKPVGLPVSAYVSAMVTGKGGTGTYTLSANQGGAVASADYNLVLQGAQSFGSHFFPWFVYNPDDANSGYLYMQCIVGSNIFNTSAWNGGLWSTADLDTWTFQGIAFTNRTDPGTGFVSPQTVYRRSTGDWISYGTKDGANDGTKGYWTSTDGRRFEYQSSTTNRVGASTYDMSFTPKFNVGGQDYILTSEDARGSFYSAGTTYASGDRVFISTYSGTKYPNAPSGPRDEHYYEFQTYISLTNGNVGNSPASSPAQWQIASDGGFFLTQLAIDSNGGALASPAPTRISDMYAGTFPGPDYVTATSGYVEDGIHYGFLCHGFFPSLNGATLQQPYTAGGGLSQEYIDLYLTVIDATAAAVAAPPGVRVKCADGVVTLTWYDVVPGHAYRIYRGTSAGSITTNLADVSNVAMYEDHTATPGSVYYYKVVTLDSGVEAGSRVVSTYVGSYGRLVNQHVTRALAGGADASTINESKIAIFVSMLESQGILHHLMMATTAWMGVAKTSVVSRCFDLGTTILPRMGDLTLWDTSVGASTTTYSATAVNSLTPGLINPNTTSRGMYGNYGRGQGVMGRTQSIQRKSKVTVISSYLKNGSAAFTPLSMNEFGKGIVLTENASAVVSFTLGDFSTSVAATGPALTADNPHIIAGMYDGSNVSCWVEGVSGTPASGASLTAERISTMRQHNSNVNVSYPLMMGTTNSKFTNTAYAPAGSYTWSDSHAKGTLHANLLFDIDLDSTQMAAVTSFLRDDANDALTPPAPTAVMPLRFRLRRA